ncbi:MAG: MoaD/ThiS family protein [bacterium]
MNSKKLFLKVLFFAYAKEIVNKDSIKFKILPYKATTIKDILNELLISYPDLKKINFSVALNNEYVNDYNIVLKDKDVLSIIPPVSGG